MTGYYYDIYSSHFTVSTTAPCNKIHQHCISFRTNIFNSIYKSSGMCYYIYTTLFTFSISSYYNLPKVGVNHG